MSEKRSHIPRWYELADRPGIGHESLLEAALTDQDIDLRPWPPVPNMGQDSTLEVELADTDITRDKIKLMGNSERKRPASRGEIIDILHRLQETKKSATMSEMADIEPIDEFSQRRAQKALGPKEPEPGSPEYVKRLVRESGKYADATVGSSAQLIATDAVSPDRSIETPGGINQPESVMAGAITPTVRLGRTERAHSHGKRVSSGGGSHGDQGGGGTGSITDEGASSGDAVPFPWLGPVARWGIVGTAITGAVVGGAAVLDKLGIINVFPDNQPQPGGGGVQPTAEVTQDTEVRATQTDLPPVGTPTSPVVIPPTETATPSETPKPTEETIQLPESVEGSLVFAERREDGKLFALVNNNSHFGDITYTGQGQYSTPEAKQYIHGLIEQMLEEGELDFYWNQPNPTTPSGDIYIQLEDIPENVLEADKLHTYTSDMDMISSLGYIFNFDARRDGTHYTFYNLQTDSQGNRIFRIANNGIPEINYKSGESKGRSRDLQASKVLYFYMLEVLTWGREVSRNGGYPYPAISTLSPAGSYATGKLVPLENPPGDLTSFASGNSPNADIPDLIVENTAVAP